MEKTPSAYELYKNSFVHASDNFEDIYRYFSRKELDLSEPALQFLKDLQEHCRKI